MKRDEKGRFSKAQEKAELVTLRDGKAITTSLKIAEVFGKRHADVIRAIEDTQVPDEWRERNFALSSSEQKMPKGGTKQIPMYSITRDGFTILAMGFTGKQAMLFKLAYIEAYNAMERRMMMPTAADIVQDYIERFGAEWILERLERCEILENYAPSTRLGELTENGFAHSMIRRGSNPIRGGRNIATVILRAAHPDLFAIQALKKYLGA